MKYPILTNFVDGKFIQANGQYLDIYAPQTGEIISRVPLSSSIELDLAVKAAHRAFPKWAARPIKERVQIFYRYRSLLEQHRVELAALVVEENGKTFDEAAAEVDKSIELTEFACSLPQMVAGEVEEVSQGVDCRSDRDRKSTRLNSSHTDISRMPSSA